MDFKPKELGPFHEAGMRSSSIHYILIGGVEITVFLLLVYIIYPVRFLVIYIERFILVIWKYDEIFMHALYAVIA